MLHLLAPARGTALSLRSAELPTSALRTGVAALLLAAAAITPKVAGAQPTRATLAGTITDATTGLPLADAKIVVRGRPAPVATDSAGRYSVADLPPGMLVMQVRAVGFASASRIVETAAGQTVTMDVALEKVAVLPEVAVSEQPAKSGTARFADFEERRRTGRGQYLTREEIEKSNAMNLAELLRRLRGVRVNCAGFGCTIQMARSPNGCLPEYIVDGRPSPYFGPQMPIQDIQGIEVYSGSSETPAEYVGQGGCGTIVLWTKSTP